MRAVRTTGTWVVAALLLALLPPAPVHAAAGERPCDLAVRGEPLPVGVLVPCPGIRPGGWVETPSSAGCTLNFVFHGTTTDDDGRTVDAGYFVATAGHCLFEDDGREERWEPGQGPHAHSRDGRRIGSFVYAVDGEVAGANHDFALIGVDAGREGDIDPAMCHFGGPTGTVEGQLDSGTVLHHFGNGTLFGDVVPARSGALVWKGEADSTMTAAVIFGDSGSPVITSDGRALGVMSQGLPSLAIATNLAPQVARAEAVTGIDFELVTAPLAPSA